jgi:WD40 repeat protein
MTFQIFISLRFAEAGKEAEALKSTLEARGISTFLCAVESGGDIKREIVHALHGCQLAIIMGTKSYGKDTGAGFSTFEELRYIHEQRKPFFLVKMCDIFEEHETIFCLPKSVAYFQWPAGHPMPDDLVPKIIEKLVLTNPSIVTELNKKIPSPVPSSPSTIPLESLTDNESTELLLHLGCSEELRKKVKALNIVIDGGYLMYLHELEILQDLDGDTNKFRIPVLKGILAKLKKFQDNGIPSEILFEVKQRIRLEEEKRTRGEEQRRKAEQLVIQKKLEDEERQKRNRVEEQRRKAEQEARQRAEERRLAEPPITLSGHSKYVCSVSQLSDGRLASGSDDSTIKIWNVESRACERTLSGHNTIVRSVIQLLDGRLASGSWDKTIKIWNINSGTCERTLSGHSGGVQSVIQLSNGRLASGSWDATVKIWNINNGTCERTLSGHSEIVLSVIQLSDGRLASGSQDKTVKIWNVTNGTCEKTLSGHSDSVKCIIQLSDGRLASGSHDKTVKIWNVTNGTCEKTLSGHSYAVNSVILLSDGRLASGSYDNTIKIWNVNIETCERTLSGHNAVVKSVIQLSDGRLASGSDDKTVKIWNV